MSSIFISHNSWDKPFVRKLGNKLKKYGIKVWIDEAEIKVGESLIKKISEGITQMEYVGAILSKNSINSSWVQKELHLAMTKEINRRKVIVLPILIEDCNIPDFLIDKRYADFRDPSRFDESIRDLLAVFRENINFQTYQESTLSNFIKKSSNDSGDKILVKCGRCKGTGTKDRDGREPSCKVCNGTGHIFLNKDNSKTLLTCGFCKGDGTKDRDGRDPNCPACNGVGSIMIDSNYIKCVRCDGTGSRDRDGKTPVCPVCKGYGYISLSMIKHL